MVIHANCTYFWVFTCLFKKCRNKFFFLLWTCVLSYGEILISFPPWYIIPTLWSSHATLGPHITPAFQIRLCFVLSDTADNCVYWPSQRPWQMKFKKGEQHVGLSALVAVSDWMTGFIKYDKIRSEPWQVWSLSSAQSLASRASDETQFLDSAAVQEKMTCDVFVDKHNELEKQQYVVTQVRCQYQMVGERHKGRKLASHPSSLMHHERLLQRHYVRFRYFICDQKTNVLTFTAWKQLLVISPGGKKALDEKTCISWWQQWSIWYELKKCQNLSREFNRRDDLSYKESREDEWIQSYHNLSITGEKVWCYLFKGPVWKIL